MLLRGDRNRSLWSSGTWLLFVCVCVINLFILPYADPSASWRQLVPQFFLKKKTQSRPRLTPPQCYAVPCRHSRMAGQTPLRMLWLFFSCIYFSFAPIFFLFLFGRPGIKGEGRPHFDGRRPHGFAEDCRTGIGYWIYL